MLTRLLAGACVADNVQIAWNDQDPYEILSKLGRGKYSEVRRLLPFTV